MKIEKIVGRLLLTEDINSDEAIFILKNHINPDICSCGCGCLEEEVCDCNCGCHTGHEIDEQPNIVHDFKTDEEIVNHAKEQPIDGSKECNILGCSCHDKEYNSIGHSFILDIPDSFTKIELNPVCNFTNMQHQPYCKSKGALASKDCICCYYTYSPLDGTFMGKTYNVVKNDNIKKKQKLND